MKNLQILSTGFRYDGLEFWLVRNIIRQSKIHVKVTIYGNWSQTLDSVRKLENDVALCAIWLTQHNFITYDLSNIIDQQCLTLMVPRQKPINIARIIYLPLSPGMWSTVAIAFVGVILFLYGLSKWGIQLRMYDPRQLPYRRFSTAYIEVVNILTSHGAPNFPLQSPIKFAILSWLIFSFVLGIIYSSRYVSLMVSTPLTKSIDTVEDFLKSPLKIGEMIEEFSLANQQNDLKFCDNAVCAELYKRIVYEKSNKERIRNIRSGQFGYIVTRLSNHYIANVPLINRFETVPLRLMKGCFMKYYTKLAFKPWSPYTKFFSDKLDRFV